MDAGTHALDILTGRTYPLKLGFVGVVNRSQQDINSDLPMEDARRKEEEFFRNHPVYRNLAHRCGTKYLAKTLNTVSHFLRCSGMQWLTPIGLDEPYPRQTAGYESEAEHLDGADSAGVECVWGCNLLRGAAPGEPSTSLYYLI
jgi:hypothetical protein